MPTELRLDTGYVTATVTLPDKLTPGRLAAISAEVDRMLPGGWQTSTPPPHSPQIRITVTATAGTPHVRLEEGDRVLVALPVAAVATATLAYVTYTVTERARQQRGMVTAHAAAATDPGGRAVLLLGDKGAGKTSTLLALLAAGYRFLGDDLVVLALTAEGLDAHAGRRRCAVRDPRAVFGYETKSLVHLGDPDAPPAAPVSLVVRLSIHPDTAPVLTPVGPLSLAERLRLAENLARYITGTPTPLRVEPHTYAPVYPLDDPARAVTRATVIDRIGALGVRYLHAPTPRHAAGLIERLMPS
ncbi:MAG: hypothetical protein ACRDRI_11485 [Pseudonocardiaceae bacterium]